MLRNTRQRRVALIPNPGNSLQDGAERRYTPATIHATQGYLAMLVVAGYIRIAPGYHRAAVSAAKSAMEATRQEPGCISYTFSADLEDASLFYVFEEWKNQAALDEHFQQPHMVEFQKTLATLGVIDMQIRRYAIAQIGPLRD
jgi:quinol monooxygenase YgiN